MAKLANIPQSAGGGAWVRLNSQAATFQVSVGDGESETVDLKGAVLAIDLKNHEQGWLSVGQAGADWRPLSRPDDWSDRPSRDHRPGIRVHVHSDRFPEPHVRELRGNSKAVLDFLVNALRLTEVEDTDLLPDDAVPTFKVEKIVRKKISATMSTTEVSLKIAPRDRWLSRADFDAARGGGHPAEAGGEADGDDW